MAGRSTTGFYTLPAVHSGSSLVIQIDFLDLIQYRGCVINQECTKTQLRDRTTILYLKHKTRALSNDISNVGFLIVQSPKIRNSSLNTVHIQELTLQHETRIPFHASEKIRHVNLEVPI